MQDPGDGGPLPADDNTLRYQAEGSLRHRATLTALALIAYVLMQWIPLPGFDRGALREILGESPLFGFGHGSILALEITPFLTGFMLVELYSLLTPWGRRTRKGAAAGRRQLSTWSIRISIVICLTQAFAVVFSSESMQTPGGVPLISDPGWLTRIIVALTMTTASVAAFAICHFITIKGLGNGFCFVVVLDVVKIVVAGRHGLAEALDAPVSGSLITYLAACVGVVSFVLYLIRTSPSYPVSPTDLSPMSMRLAFLPQGILPVTWSWSILGWAGILYKFGSAPYLVCEAVSVVVLSLISVRFFSTRKRLEHNLGDVIVPEDFDALLRRRLMITVPALAFAMAGLSALRIHVVSDLYLPGFVNLVMIAAIGVDLTREWRFRRHHPEPARLVELDNVQLALYVESVLAERGIDCLVQALHLRSLLFFFGPLYKMAILVPADSLEEAGQAWEAIDASIV